MGFLAVNWPFPVQDERPSRTAHPHFALPSLFCFVTHHNLSVLSEGRYAHAARTDPAIKYMTQKALVRACSAWAIRVSKAQICCSGRREQDIVRPPLPFKLHQNYRLLPCFIREFNPASQEIWSGPVECRQIPPANTLQNKCGDDGDDLNTAVGISLLRWCGNAVIVTALLLALS